MRVPLIGDRFAPVHGGRYLDLATGQHVLLHHIVLGGEAAREWSEACAAELAQHGAGPAALIDYGVTGSNRCFEARSTGNPERSFTIADLEATTQFAERVVSAATADRRGIHVVQIAEWRTIDKREAGSHIARRLRRHGYVTATAHIELSDRLLSTLAHRHVVLLCFSADDRQRAAEWIRRFGFVSPRAHLVVDASGATVPAAVEAAMRERAPVYASGLEASRHLRRAGAFQQRRRLAASARWLRAAVVSAQREHHESSELQAGRLLLDVLLRQGDVKAACKAAWTLAREVGARPHRFDAAAIAARTLIRCAELRDAESLLATTTAECALLRRDVPAELRLCDAEVCFWQGRLERAVTLLESLRPYGSIEIVKWRGLIAWATSNVATLRDAVATLAAAGTETATRWSRTLDLLLDARGRDVSSAIAAARELIALGESDGLLLAVAVEGANTSSDARADFARCLDPASPCRRSMAPLHALAIRWVCAGACDRKAGSDLMREVQRRGVLGLLRWGLGRRGMRLSESVPRLLQLVTDAEDDQHALASACAWIANQPGVSAVTFVSAGDGRVLCGSALDSLDLTDDELHQTIHAPRAHAIVQSGRVVAIAPVRYGGRPIAAVIACGRSDVAETLKEIVDTAAPLCAPVIRTRLDAIALATSRDTLTPEILGRSPALHAVREAIARAAVTAFPVLIEGESGTGKELVARALHRLSARRERRFCAVNCAALTDELVEAELFGYARGAFTGAVGARAGLFEEAHHGTLFLDEIRELSARAQAKLLRALQEREIRRLGENVSRPVDVRIVAATNQPLGQAASQGDFREDLVFRLAVVRIRMPPLRERVEDVPLLAHAFWRQMTAQTGTHARLGPDALAALSRHGWPGNVRELQNAIASLIVLAPARGRVGARHVRQVLDGASTTTARAIPLEDARRAFEREVIAATLARHGGRRAAAAQELGLTRQGLLKAIRRVGLQPGTGDAGVA